MISHEEYLNEIDNSIDENEFKNYQIERLKPAISIIKQIVKHQFKSVEFKSQNGGIYAMINLNSQIENRKIVLIKGRLNKNNYHIEIDNENTICIHNKTILPLEKNNDEVCNE